MLFSRLELFPVTAAVRPSGQDTVLTIAGCDLGALAREHGTPLYVYDRATMDGAVAGYRRALASYPGRSGLTYAGKAFLCMALARWVVDCDLWLDCTGQGELGIAAAAGTPRDRILVHGVNKSPDDLVAAVAQAGTLVVDNLPELARLARLAQDAAGPFPDLWLRYRPGLAVATHAHTQTGQPSSKFGMDEGEIGDAARLCRRAGLPLTGLHFHLGSHFHDPGPVGEAIGRALDLAATLALRSPWTLCPGGGLGVAYHEDDLPGPDVVNYGSYVVEQVLAGCRQRGLALPRLQLEPGRSLVARAGVAIYRVGTVKQAGGRRWLLLDGGLADNPRPALYYARYSALPVRDPLRPAADSAWLAGPYCESGDVLIQDLPLPEVQPGDLLAVPVSGAYHLSMAGNYNGARRPAVLWLEGGHAHLVQRRERVADLLAREVIERASG